VADIDRLPPHSVEAEEAVLGSLLVDPDAILEVAPFLRPEAFYRDKNRWVYEACCSLSGATDPVPINQITVAEELARRGRLEAVGGSAYLSHLVAVLPTSVHVEYYGRIVHRLSLMRQLIEAAGQIAAIGYEQDPDVDAALSRAEDLLYKLHSYESSRDFEHIRPVMHRYFDDISPIAPPSEAKRLTHVRTGFAGIDDLLGGLQQSDMIVLAARPSMGKSSLALNIARNAAVAQEARIAIFSIEMSKEQLVHRLLASEAGIDSQHIRRGHPGDVQHAKLLKAAEQLHSAAIWVDDSPSLRPAEMRSKARRLDFEHGIDLVIIDYLQLMQSDRRTDNKVQEVTDISRSLKALARELNVPVLALSQLSRAVESRPRHTPMLSDLRESGSIEQDADVVVFINREELHYKRDEWERQFPDKPYPEGLAEITIAKHRNGPIGGVVLRFRHEITKFENTGLEEIESGQPSLPRFPS